MDVNRIESVLDLYTNENALVCVEMIACDKCQTLASPIDIEEAIREHGIFDCSRCSRQLDQAGFHASDVISAYYFQPESVKRVVKIAATKTDRNPTVPIAMADQDQNATELDLSKNEAKIVTSMLESCFEGPSDILNFVSNSSARSIRGDLETNTLSNAIRTLQEQSHRRELLGDVLLDLAERIPEKRDRIIAIANHVQAKYRKGSEHWNCPRKVDSGPILTKR